MVKVSIDMEEQRPTLGFYMFLRNGVKYDYPFEEAILSALPIADKIVICECFSDDDTQARLEVLRSKYYPIIDIVHQPWITDFTQLCNLGNYCVPFLDTDWQWQLQADEVLHQDSYPKILSFIENAPPSVTAARINYFHFLANYETEFDFCYRSILRPHRKNSGWRLIGDACEIAKSSVVVPNEVASLDIHVYHYGKVHEGEVGWQKEWDFQQLYTSIGFPDPKMKQMQEKLGKNFCDYVYLFESCIKEGKVRKFDGTHPVVMQDRISRFKSGGWEQFQSRMKEGLSI